MAQGNTTPFVLRPVRGGENEFKVNESRVRSSSISRAGRRRAGALRRVRGLRPNRWRIQERVIIGNLLAEQVGLRYTGTATTQARRPGVPALSLCLFGVRRPKRRR